MTRLIHFIKIYFLWIIFSFLLFNSKVFRIGMKVNDHGDETTSESVDRVSEKKRDIMLIIV